MTVQVRLAGGEYRIGGDWDGVKPANAFLGHLRARAFSPATVRAYAFDVVNLARFLIGQGLRLAAVTPVDVFAWVDWQGARRDGTDRPGTVVALRRRTAAASTVNRRVAAAGVLRVPGHDRCPHRQSGAITAAWSGHPPGGPRAARSPGAGPPARWRPAGAPAAPPARVPSRRGC